MFEQLASLNELHDEVDAVRLLEHVVHADNEGMVHLVQDELFDLQRLHRLVLDYYVFSDDFHGVVLVLQLVAHQVDLAESATPDDTDQLKVIPRHLSHRRAPVQQAGPLVASHQVSVVEEKLSVEWPGREVVVALAEIAGVDVDGAAVKLVALPRHRFKLFYQALVGIPQCVTLHHRGAHAELWLALFGILLELDVFLVNPGEDKRHSRDSTSNVLFRGGIICQVPLLEDAKDGQVLLAKGQVRHFDDLEDYLATGKSQKKEQKCSVRQLRF